MSALPSTAQQPSGWISADLHCHSVASDGTLPARELAQRARERGVALWALTDHDELAGLPEAREAAQGLGLAWVSGVEISVSFAGETVHIVGLGFDPQHQGLRQGLAAIRAGRRDRAIAMGRDLERVGLHGVFEGAAALAPNPALVTRTHFARHLVNTGVCPDMGSVFRRYLVEGKPGYVPHQWARLGDAVSWIRAAGGVAVIAHPARYHFSANEEYALFSEFKAHGGAAVEVVTGSHSHQDSLRVADLAREFELAASVGSDFHSPTESRLDLGGCAALPPDLRPVWALL